MFRDLAGRRMALFAMVVSSGAAACTTDIAPLAVATVNFGVPQDSVLNSKTYQTTVQVRDLNGVDIKGRPVTYESLFPLIATVDASGLVSAKAVGVASIKATVEGRTATATIKVLDRATRVVVTPLQDNVPIGQTRQMTVAVTGANGATIAGRNVRFQSSNPAVATITAGGLVSAVSKGTTTITADAELDQVNGTATITVVDVPVASLSISPIGTQILRLGAFLQATAVTRDASNNVVTGRTVTWSSSNSTIASVTASGLITALALGSVTVTAESEGRSSSMGVSVTEVPIKTVTLSPDSVTVLTGNIRQLLPTVLDSLNRVLNSLASRSVLWTSKNPAVASVSSSGVVTGLTAGSAQVNVTIDNVRSNDVVVTVTDQIQTIRLAPFQSQLLRVGNTLLVTAAALNNQSQVIPGKVFNWSSSNPSVASVTAAGLVTAVAPGTVSITAESDGKTGSVTVQVTLVPIGKVTLVPSADTLISGDQKQYNPVVTDTAGKPVTSLIGRNVFWTSDNIPAASVSGQGIVQASVSQSGTAVVNVTIDGVVSNTLTIKVSQVAIIDVSPSPLTVGIGNSITLVVVLRDIVGNVLTTNRTTNFFVGAPTPALVTVSPAGVVTGASAGTTTIIVSVSGVSVTKSVPVTVTP